MCNTCGGQIILRTADGFEKVVKVADCDINTYFTAIIDRNKSVRAFYSTDMLSCAMEQSYSYKREYRWKREMKDGIRVLNEVLSWPSQAQPRSIEALEFIKV